MPALPSCLIEPIWEQFAVLLQAKSLLWAADGIPNQEIARRCEVDSDAVRRWRTRFAAKGVDGVGVIAKGRGRKPR